MGSREEEHMAYNLLLPKLLKPNINFNVNINLKPNVAILLLGRYFVRVDPYYQLLDSLTQDFMSQLR